jgi:hypothetical protein
MDLSIDASAPGRRRFLLALLALSVGAGCDERRSPASQKAEAPCLPSRCRPLECAVWTWPEPIPDALEETGWRLTASLDRDRFRVDEPIHVTLVLENVSGRDLECVNAGSDFDYIPYCQVEGGGAPPPTCYGETVAGKRGRHLFGVLAVPAGGHVVHGLLLTRFVDLSVAGRYTLRVARAHLGEPRTLSNQCSFEVG